MAQLVWKQSGGESKTFALSDSTVLGRGSTADFALPDSSVSRQHARIEQRESDYFILDLGSRNGTRVNGGLIACETRLSTGDRIDLGDLSLEFVLGPGTDSLTRGSLGTEPLSGLVAASLKEREKDEKPASSERRESLPRRLGKFYLLERLGQGGMGTVYRAIDLDSNQQVAVKFIRTNIGRREAFLDFFHNREAVLAREINHPNVIQIYEYGVDGPRHFIAMEYVSGENLFHALRRGPFQPLEVVEVLRQIACGLAAAHRQGVVHSDIKPANVLLAIGEAAPDGEVGKFEDVRYERVEEADGLLEFGDSEKSATAAPLSQRYDAGVLEEVRRRLGGVDGETFVDPPYFERRAEAQFLEHYLERSAEGRGYILVVGGDAGSGKDRLVSHVLEKLETASEREDGAPIHYELDCSRVEGLPRLFEQVFGTAPRASDGAKDVARAMAESLVDHFSSVRTHVVLRLLDLGGASPFVVEFIRQLAIAAANLPVTTIGTVNPEEIRTNGSLKPILDGLGVTAKELYLRPLTEYQIQRYLHQTFRNALPDDRLAADLYRLSGGNFSRLLDLVRSFFDRGVLRLDPRSGRLSYRPRAQEFELEEGKNLYEKYRALGRVEQRVLEHAAFIGPRFLFETLHRFDKVDETALFFIVRTLLAEGFFVEESRDWYGFTNLAFQSYMADKVPKSERPHFHRTVSRLLQSVALADSPELAQLRARHFEGCREEPRAVQALLEGAHLARTQYKLELYRAMIQDVLRIYRGLANLESRRKGVVAALRAWFKRDGNWYEVLGELASQPVVARAKIADFGISFRVRDEAKGFHVDRRPVLGTPRYLAPERARGDAGGPKADIFSLGIIAYEMVTGNPPFPNLKGREAIQANATRKIVCPEEQLAPYPPAMRDLLAGMVERDPERRWDAERVLRAITEIECDFQRRPR